MLKHASVYSDDFACMWLRTTGHVIRPLFILGDLVSDGIIRLCADEGTLHLVLHGRFQGLAGL